VNHIELGQLVLDRLCKTQLPNSVVAKFVDVTERTVTNWKKGHVSDQPITPPRGEQLNRLWRLLAATGAPSPELKELDSFHFILGHLLAFGVITLDKARDICGDVGPQSVLETIRGDRMPANRKFEAEQLKKDYRARLIAAEVGLQTRIDQVRHNNGLPPYPPIISFEQLAPAMQEPAPSSKSATSRAARQKSDSDPTETLLLELAMDIGSILPALRYLLSDDCTVEQREKFRKLVGGDTLHILGVMVHGLVSERTVQTVRNQEGR
jgi:hypothetical protein